jgi:nicotinamide-nucleotide amidase
VTDDAVAQGPGEVVSPSGEREASSGSEAAPPGPSPSTTSPSAEALALVSALTRSGRTMAVAESLTGGAVAAAVVDVPGASRVLRGAVVAYATDLKAALLGVDPALLERSGPVHPDVAAQMARGVRTRLGADLGLATTGVAGPQDQDGHPPGEVHLAVAWADGVRVRSLRLDGDRAAVRAEAGRAVLALALAVEDAPGPPGNTQVAERVG